MAVIINEFEILTQAPSPSPNTSAPPPPVPQQSELVPLDIERILRWHRERLARVRAH
jgi:hypothetical protein